MINIDEILESFCVDLQDKDTKCLVYITSKDYDRQPIIYAFDTPEEAMKFARRRNELFFVF